MLKFLKKILYALPFGLKAGEELMSASNDVETNGTTIQNKIENKSVYNDLINGELTQEVEELRYETYLAEEESNDFQHIGNGVSIKNNNSNKKQRRRKFVQENIHMEYGLNESMTLLENKDYDICDNMKNRSIFKIEYNNPCVRFWLENYLDKVAVDLNDDEYRTTLYFVDDPGNRHSRPLVNFIKKTKQAIDSIKEEGNEKKLQAYLNKNELCSEIESLSFTTFNASNHVPNGVDYNFTEPHFEDIDILDYYVTLEFTWKSFYGNKLLSEKFYSKTGADKFKNKEKRDTYKEVVEYNPNQEEELVVRDRVDYNDEKISKELENWFNNTDSNISLEPKVE